MAMSIDEVLTFRQPMETWQIQCECRIHRGRCFIKEIPGRLQDRAENRFFQWQVLFRP